MKKLLLLFAALFMAIAANAWSVKFTNPNNWTNVNVYAWDNGYSGKAGGWPGAAMTKGADGLWTFEETGTAVPGKIIFNNGSAQTGDLTFGTANDGKTFNYYGPEDAVLNEYKIYFDNSTAKWAKVYLYGWNGVATAVWPGDEVTEKDARGYFVYTFKGESAPTGGNIIWNNGSGTQTANLTWETDAVYDQNGPVNAKEETYTVYFNNTAGWSNVYVYTFNPELAGSWPGTKLTAKADGSYQWDYVSKVAPSCEGIIFNDGGSKQTDDLTYTVGATYNNGSEDSGGYTSWWVNVNGDFNNYASDNGVHPNAEGISETKNVAIGSGEFEINAYYDGADHYYGNSSAVKVDEWIQLNADGGHMTVAGASADATFDVQFNCVTNQIYLSLVSGTISDEEPEPTYPENMYVIGEVNGGKWDPESGLQMINEGDGFYTLENVKIDNYFALTSVLGSWDDVNANRFGPATSGAAAIEGENDATGTGDTSWQIATPGVYNMYFSYDDKILELEAVEVSEPDPMDQWWVVLNGDFNEWSTDGGIQSKDGIYEFKEVKIGSGDFEINIWNGVQNLYFGTPDPIVLRTTTTVTQNGGHMTLADGDADKEYNVTFDYNKGTIFIDFSTGINNIDADNNVRVEYYNLQGVRIAAPEKGLYIIRQGEKVTKILK